METPCALVISYSKSPANDLVKGILQRESLPENTGSYGDMVKSYHWPVDTKYYTADVHLCTVVENNITSKEMLENMQALVVQFDEDKETGLNDVKMLMSILGGFEPDVRLLVCGNCSHDNSAVSRHAALDWCLKNGFELVELYPDETSDSEDDFAETTGMKRIIQALQAHMWSNMIMKDKKTFCYPKLEQLLRLDTQPENKSAAGTVMLEAEMKNLNFQESENSLPGTSLPMEDELASILGSDDQEQSFESLFDKFQLMKDKAKDLPFSERRVYAERVAIAFWRAMGGDEDEISGLQDSIE